MGCPETAKKKKFQIGPHLSEVAQRILWRKKMKSAANVGWMSAGVTATTKLNTGKQRDHRKRPPMTLIDKWMGIIRINQRAPSDKKRAQRSWNYSKTQIRFLELTGFEWLRSSVVEVLIRMNPPTNVLKAATGINRVQRWFNRDETLLATHCHTNKKAQPTCLHHTNLFIKKTNN